MSSSPSARVGRWIINGLFTAAVMAFLVFGLGPHTGWYRTVTILSNSMQPNFSAGDVVISTPMAAGRVSEGDVISFHAPIEGHPLVTHRVVEVVERGVSPTVRTRGDANDAIDPWSAKLEAGTVWRQRASIPIAGSAIRMLRNPAVKIITTIAMPCALVVAMLTSIWRPRRPTEGLEWEMGDIAVHYEDPWFTPWSGVAPAAYGSIVAYEDREA